MEGDSDKVGQQWESEKERERERERWGERDGGRRERKRGEWQESVLKRED